MLTTGQFKIPPELVFSPDDLLLYDQGPTVLQHDRQRRVISGVMELGFVATHSEFKSNNHAYNATVLIPYLLRRDFLGSFSGGLHGPKS